MKKSLVVLGNILIVLSVLISVIFDVIREHRIMLTSKTEAFENMTVAMESVTTNYLEGEQEVCNSWANYINAHAMTAEEAAAFIRDSLSAPDVMAHIVFPGEDGLAGLSTAPKASIRTTLRFHTGISAFSPTIRTRSCGKTAPST